MFYYIEGMVTELDQNLAVLDCGGVGYALNVTLNTLSRLKLNSKSKLYVTESVSENAFDLYGFFDKAEKRCFEMLISVSGIGPKGAISVLSYSTPEALALAIMNDDLKALTVAPGIGKKIAQRVILELKDKIKKDSGDMLIQPVYVEPAAGEDNAMSDAVKGLSVLGYSSMEIAPVLKKLDTSGMTAEQIIKAVLKLMVK